MESGSPFSASVATLATVGRVCVSMGSGGAIIVEKGGPYLEVFFLILK